jgi:hypothetical protein
MRGNLVLRCRARVVQLTTEGHKGTFAITRQIKDYTFQWQSSEIGHPNCSTCLFPDYRRRGCHRGPLFEVTPDSQSCRIDRLRYQTERSDNQKVVTARNLRFM